MSIKAWVWLLLFAGVVAGCQYGGPTYYEDRYGVHTDYYNYPAPKIYEESYYYRGSPYNPYRDPHHHHYNAR